MTTETFVSGDLFGAEGCWPSVVPATDSLIAATLSNARDSHQALAATAVALGSHATDPCGGKRRFSVVRALLRSEGPYCAQGGILPAGLPSRTPGQVASVLGFGIDAPSSQSDRQGLRPVSSERTGESARGYSVQDSSIGKIGSISTPTGLREDVILPGLISAVFYRRRPSAVQISLGLVFTVGLSGVLGYVQDIGTPRVWVNAALAIAGGVVLYVAILAYLVYAYYPKHAKPGASARPPSS